MRRAAIALLVAFGLATPPAWAALQITSDHRAIFFGLMKLDESKELAQSGSYHNEITCISTNGRQWQLKISLLQPLVGGGEEIAMENFEWQLAATTGHGNPAQPYRFVPFSLMPELVYMSATDEAEGTPVRFQFKYRLKIPELQVSGTYQTTIRITVTEML